MLCGSILLNRQVSSSASAEFDLSDAQADDSKRLKSAFNGSEPTVVGNCGTSVEIGHYLGRPENAPNPPEPNPS